MPKSFEKVDYNLIKASRRKRGPPMMKIDLIKVVLVDVDGEAHVGSFEISDGTLTVKSNYSWKSMQVIGMEATGLAKAMLGDLVRDEIKQGLHAKRSG